MHFNTIKKNTISIPRQLPNGQQEITNYTFNCINAKRAGIIGYKLAGKVINVLGNMNFGVLSLQEVFGEDSVEHLYELIFSQECQLSANGQFIQDPDVFFQGRIMEMYMLLGHALRFNCEDFFTIIGGWLKKNNNSSEILKAMKENGVELPPSLLNLFGITLETKEEE